MYEERQYRQEMIGGDLATYVVTEEESDCWIASSKALQSFAEERLHYYRGIVKAYGKKDNEFYESLQPLECADYEHDIIKRMHNASHKAGIGPMAGIAGAISEYIGRGLFQEMLKSGVTNPEIIVENGGDIYLNGFLEKIISIYAGSSKLSHKIGIKIPADKMPLGICTSAGTVGHSKSFGKADAVCIISKDTILADVVATATGNRIHTKADIASGIDFAKSIDGILGVIIIIEDELGVWGDFELVKV